MLHSGKRFRLDSVFRQRLGRLRSPFACRQRGLGLLQRPAGGRIFGERRLGLVVGLPHLGDRFGDDLLGRCTFSFACLTASAWVAIVFVKAGISVPNCVDFACSLSTTAFRSASAGRAARACLVRSSGLDRGGVASVLAFSWPWEAAERRDGRGRGFSQLGQVRFLGPQFLERLVDRITGGERLLAGGFLIGGGCIDRRLRRRGRGFEVGDRASAAISAGKSNDR